MNLIILASGNLGSICLDQINKYHSICYIFTDRHSAAIIAWTKIKNIPVYIGNPQKIEDYDFLRRYKNAFIVSINYLFLINNRFINSVDGRAINIHGALLPKYRGRTPHIWAIINGETTTGITVHKMVEGMDAGDILVQETIIIQRDDTGGTILDKFNKRYPQLILNALSTIEKGEAVYRPQDNTKATYFPKRTPDDGLIKWFWQGERIHNWVRALTKPYPGAFAINSRNGKKIVIWKCELDRLGFDGCISDGQIIKCEETVFFIKCQNCVIKVSDYEGIVALGDQLV
jgi:methionyl-tRNA formyltransferase